MSRRDGLLAETRTLVGLQAVDPDEPVVAGAHLFTIGDEQKTDTDQGWITSACHSPHLKCGIGLGYLVQGAERLGEEVLAANPLEGQSTRVRVVSPHFIDPEGGRLRV